MFADLSAANLNRANLAQANFAGSKLPWAKLRGAVLQEAYLGNADLTWADLSGSIFIRAILPSATLRMADLREANLHKADLRQTDLSGARLQGARLDGADLHLANLSYANLSGAELAGANLNGTCLEGADLAGANLSCATLVDTNLTGANLTGCRVYGISAWRLVLEGSKQENLVITSADEPEITVDSIEVAQFVYLLLHNEKIRDVIDTIGKKGVLLLGRFTEGRIQILERLREELRSRGYLPIIFNFDKPETKNFTETVRLLAELSHFVIADVTNPKSASLELQATIPAVMVPFRPIIQEGEKPFAMLEDLWIQHRDWVFEPLYYSSLDALVGALDEKIIEPAKVRFAELLARKAEKMKGEHV
jgi:pentapeptide repeat protein